jgi:uncharacterized membrane protein YgcG
MKTTIFSLAIIAIALSSCTTAYQTGQTPDDVYYSPVRERVQDEYVNMEQKDRSDTRHDEDYYDDRYLRMKVHNRSRWGNLNDWYASERWNIGYYSYYSPYYYNPYSSWNYFYNPYFISPYYYSHNYYYGPGNYYGQNHYTGIYQNNIRSTYVAPRHYNLNTYGSNSPSYNQGSGNYTVPSNSTRSNNRGGALRDIFNGTTSGGNNGGGNTGGSSGNSGGSSGSNSGSSSSSNTNAPVRRF